MKASGENHTQQKILSAKHVTENGTFYRLSSCIIGQSNDFGIVLCSVFEQNMIADRWRGQRSNLTIIIKPDTVRQGFIRWGKHRPFMLQKPPLGAICVFLLFPPEKQRKTQTSIAECLFKYRFVSIVSHHFHFSSGSFLAFFFPPLESFFTSLVLFFGFLSWTGQI